MSIFLIILKYLGIFFFSFILGMIYAAWRYSRWQKEEALESLTKNMAKLEDIIELAKKRGETNEDYKARQ